MFSYRKIRLFYRETKKYIKKNTTLLLFTFLMGIIFYFILSDLTSLGRANKSKDDQINYLNDYILKIENRMENNTEVFQEQIQQLKEQVAKPLPIRLARKLFKDDAVTFLAVIKSESGLNPRAKGYNCYYDGKSKACRVEDRAKAWSVDCGIVQNNFRGTECPEYSLDVKWSITEAHNKYLRRGFQPWSVFNKNIYKNNLGWARQQLI